MNFMSMPWEEEDAEKSKEKILEVVIDLTEKNERLESINKELVKALKLITLGTLSEMKMWLLKNEPQQPNNHAPLVDCNQSMLSVLIAEQVLAKAKE